MEVRTKQPTGKGQAEFFTGDVWIDPVGEGRPPSKLRVGVVHFTPGAHTAWHSHDGGQTLYVTEGRGLIQARGDQAVSIRPGDVIYTPDGEEHWHGASVDHFMTHITITEGGAKWGPHVSDEDYRRADQAGPT
jgi:quercetin dioxygenase-like cupin family protein